MATNPLVPSFRYPFESEIAHLAPEVQQAHRSQWNAITDLYQANASLKSQIEDTKSSITSTVTTNTNNTSETVIIASSVIGNINNQTGNTAYTSQQSDYGSFVILSDASPVAVTLNDGVTLPWFSTFLNLNTGVVTITPASGTINGNATFTLPQNNVVTIIYDGATFWAEPMLPTPQNTPPITHEWINSYNASTGAFSQTRPDYSDLTGTPQLPNTIAPVAGEYITGYNASTGNFSQSTPAGISTTIATAKLTVGGANGSMTFTSGILTAQTPAT